MLPRPYQTDTVNKIQLGKSNIIIAPARVGKSFIAKLIIDQYFTNKKVVVICSRRTIILQFEEYFKDNISWILAGKDYDHTQSIFLASFQTLQKRKNINYSEFSAVIIDECHEHANTKTTKALKEQIGTIIGLTATPLTNKNKLLTGWDNWVRTVDIKTMVENKWLAPTTYLSANDTISEDKEGMAKKANGDYTEEAIRQVIDKNGLILRIKDYITKKDVVNSSKALVYINFIETAEELYKKIKHLGNVFIYHSKRSTKENRETLEAYDNAKTAILINVRALAVGYNSPSSNMVIYGILTPIHSLALQILPRSSTYQPNKIATVVDLTGQLIGSNAVNPYTDFSEYGKIKPNCKQKCLEFTSELEKFMCMQSCNDLDSNFIICKDTPSQSFENDHYRSEFVIRGECCGKGYPVWEYSFKTTIPPNTIFKLWKWMKCKCGHITRYTVSTVSEPATMIELYQPLENQNKITCIYSKKPHKCLLIIEDVKLKSYKYKLVESQQELYSYALQHFKNRKFTLTSNIPLDKLANVKVDKSLSDYIPAIDFTKEKQGIMRKIIKLKVLNYLEQFSMNKHYAYYFMKEVNNSNEKQVVTKLNDVYDKYALMDIKNKLEHNRQTLLK